MKGNVLGILTIVVFIGFITSQINNIKQRYNEQLEIDRSRISAYTSNYSY
jgi:hypothetical protein